MGSWMVRWKKKKERDGRKKYPQSSRKKGVKDGRGANSEERHPSVCIVSLSQCLLVFVHSFLSPDPPFVFAFSFSFFLLYSLLIHPSCLLTERELASDTSLSIVCVMCVSPRGFYSYSFHLDSNPIFKMIRITFRFFYRTYFVKSIKSLHSQMYA